MKPYALFLVVAIGTVMSPGPGVVMTLTNALRHGMRGTFGGILGIAFGALVVAAISATSLGILLATSAPAFTALKLVGAAYLIYLGIRLWRAPPLELSRQSAPATSFAKRFGEGLSLQITNPNAVFFFLSVFPQFIDPQGNYALQFSALVATYCTLVVVLHCAYGLFAGKARSWLASEKGGLIVNRTAGVMLVFFGAALARVGR